MRRLPLVSSFLALVLVSLVPALASAQEIAPGRLVHVRFVASDPVVTFHVPTGSLGGVAWTRYGAVGWAQQSFRPVCTAPCERLMPPDTYRFALSLESGGAILAPGALELRDGATVYGHYVDNSVTRGLGAALATLSGLGCAALALAGAVAFGTQEDWDAAIPWWVGAGGAFVAMWIGLGMSWVFDHTEVRVLAPGEVP